VLDFQSVVLFLHTQQKVGAWFSSVLLHTQQE